MIRHVSLYSGKWCLQPECVAIFEVYGYEYATLKCSAHTTYYLKCICSPHFGNVAQNSVTYADRQRRKHLPLII